MNERESGAGPSARRVPASVWAALVAAAGALNIALTFFSGAPLLPILSVAVCAGAVGFGAVVLRERLSVEAEARAGGADARFAPLCWSGALIVYLALAARILAGRETGVDIALWSLGMLLVALPLLRDVDIRLRLPDRELWTDCLIVGGLMALAVVLHAHDLRDWYYAAIGDEIGFYLRIREIIEYGISDPFTVQGVYYNSSMLNSVYQAAFSWIFGGGSAWGWKFSSVMSVALTLPPIYMLGLRFSGRTAGVMAAVIVLSSHYLMAFSHTGYTHLDALPVIAWVVLAFAAAIRRERARLLLVAGLLAGLALYTALPARVVFPLFLFWAALKLRTPERLLSLWPAAAGFAACAAPYLLDNGMESILVMGRDTMSPYSIYHSEIGDPVSRLAGNLRNLALWWHNPDWMRHYISGSLLDRVSGVMVLVGIGTALIRWRSADKMLVFWLLATMVPTALLSPYPQPPITRMHATMLPMALLSGVMVGSGMRVLGAGGTLRWAMVCVIAFGVTGLNQFRFQYVTPNATEIYMPETLAVRAWRSEECGLRPDTQFIGPHGHLMDLVLMTYMPTGDRPAVTESYDDPRVLEDSGGCKIFFRPDDEGARVALSRLSARTETYENPRGTVRVKAAVFAGRDEFESR